jgi:hypothetical protein
MKTMKLFMKCLVGVMMNHEVFPQIVNHLDRVFAVPQIYGMIDFQSPIISSK